MLNKPAAYMRASGSVVGTERINVHRCVDRNDNIIEAKPVIKTISLQSKVRIRLLSVEYVVAIHLIHCSPQPTLGSMAVYTFEQRHGQNGCSVKVSYFQSLQEE